MATYNCRVLSSEDKLKLFSIKKHDRTWHCKVRRLSPSATPANRHTSGIIIYPAPEQKKGALQNRGKIYSL